MVLQVIENNLVHKLEEVQNWKVYLAANMECIQLFNTPHEELASSSDSNRTPDRENGEDLEDSD